MIALHTCLSLPQRNYLATARDAIMAEGVRDVGEHTRITLDVVSGLLIVESVYFVAGEDYQTRYRDYIRRDGTTAAQTSSIETRGWGDSDARSNEH